MHLIDIVRQLQMHDVGRTHQALKMVFYIKQYPIAQPKKIKHPIAALNGQVADVQRSIFLFYKTVVEEDVHRSRLKTNVALMCVKW